MNFQCAAKHLCVASHVHITPLHRCRQCKQFLHVFCAGKGETVPDDDCQNGLEYDCVLCCNGELLGRFNPPLPSSKSSSISSKSVQVQGPVTQPRKGNCSSSLSGTTTTIQQPLELPVPSPKTKVSHVTTDISLPLPTNKPTKGPSPCTLKEWIHAIQEAHEDSPGKSSCRSLATQYPSA